MVKWCYRGIYHCNSRSWTCSCI